MPAALPAPPVRFIKVLFRKASTSLNAALSGWHGGRLKPDSVGKNWGATWRHGNTNLANQLAKKDTSVKNTRKTLSNALSIAFNAANRAFYTEA